MYSSDCGGLPTALVRVGCFGVKGNLGTERATAWSRANPLGGPLGGPLDGPSEASRGATRGGGAGGQQGPVSVSALKRGLKELSSLSSSSVKSVTINDAVLAAVAGAVGDLNAQADARRVLETGEQAGTGALGYEPRALTVITRILHLFSNAVGLSLSRLIWGPHFLPPCPARAAANSNFLVFLSWR